LLIALLLELGITAGAFIMNEEVIKSLTSTLQDDIVKYNVTSNNTNGKYDLNPFTTNLHHLDFLQIRLKCCGVQSYQDWETNIKLAATNSLPDSCCKVPSINCGVGAMKKPMKNNVTSEEAKRNEIYLLGCEHQSKGLFKRNALVFGSLVIVIFGIQAIAIILSWCLSEQMRDKRLWKYSDKKRRYHSRNYS
jgi:hypothetical protein